MHKPPFQSRKFLMCAAYIVLVLLSALFPKLAPALPHVWPVVVAYISGESLVDIIRAKYPGFFSILDNTLKPSTFYADVQEGFEDAHDIDHELDDQIRAVVDDIQKDKGKTTIAFAPTSLATITPTSPVDHRGGGRFG
jgi:hypothetical protein